MVAEFRQDADYQRSRHLHNSGAPGYGTEHAAHAGHSNEAPARAGGEQLSLQRSLLGDGRLLGGRGNEPVRQAALLSMQRTHGNRAVQRALSPGRQGRGVPVQRDVPVQEEQQISPASSFMYQPQPSFAPIPSPMNGFSGKAHSGPVASLSPSPAPDMPQYDEDGRACEMGEDAVCDLSAPAPAPAAGPDTGEATPAGGPGTSVPNTDWELDKGLISKIRKGRTALSKSSGMVRQGAKEAAALAAANKALVTKTMLGNLGTGSMEEVYAGFDKYERTYEAPAAKSAMESERSGALEAKYGKTSKFGTLMSGANYGLQFLQSLAEGQGVGEAAFGAAAGGYVSNKMGSYLFKQGPGVGWADAGINLVNAGLNLIPGMPKEVTQATQVAADATPSSFATSVASTYGRGLRNVGEGLITGDWSGLKQQRQDIMHGKAGGPLQGYALAGEFINWDRDKWEEETDEMREGKWGTLPKWGVKLGDALSGPSVYEMVEQMAEKEKEKQSDGYQRRKLLDAHRQELTAKYGQEEFLKMWRGEVPIPGDVR